MRQSAAFLRAGAVRPGPPDYPETFDRAARVVLSGVAPIPWRVPAAEAALVGQKLEARAITRAAAAAVASAEEVDQNGYKVSLARGIVQSVLEGLA